MLKKNDFEGGSNGTGITAANSGGTGETAFDTVTLNGGTLTYDNAHAAHGVLSDKVVCPAFDSPFMAWNVSSPSQLWFRVYMYWTANPGNIVPFLQYADVSTTGCAFEVTTTGKLAVYDSTLTQRAITTNSIPLNAWFRVEGYAIPSATAESGEIKLFNTMDGTTATETVTSTTNLNMLAAFTSAKFGMPNGGTGTVTHWEDDIGVSDTGYIGPVVSASTQGLLAMC